MEEEEKLKGMLKEVEELDKQIDILILKRNAILNLAESLAAKMMIEGKI